MLDFSSSEEIVFMPEGKKGASQLISFQKPNVGGEGLSPRINVHCYCFGT